MFPRSSKISKSHQEWMRFSMHDYLIGKTEKCLEHDQNPCKTGLFSSLLISLSIWPVSINPNILKSHKKDQTGCPKVAGTFPSTKKWLYQAHPYPTNGTKNKNHKLKTREFSSSSMLARVPTKCQRLVDGFECWVT